MADNKTLLKQARKLIDEGKFNEAQECCKNILKTDKQNYFGLVLLGKSLQDSEQAPLAYQKAITLKPENPLAWQGLANYFERKGCNTNNLKLCQIYSELLEIEPDTDKVREIITKLSNLKISESVDALIKFINNTHDNQRTGIAEKHLLELLKTDVPCNKEIIPEVLTFLSKLYKDNPSNDLELMYAKVCIQKENISAAVQEIINLEFFTSNAILREWLCKMLCDYYVEKNSFCGFEIDKYFNLITKGIENSKYPEFLSCIQAYDKGFYLDAYRKCVSLVNYSQIDVMEISFLMDCTVRLKKWPVIEKLSIIFIGKCKDSKFLLKLQKHLCISLAKQQKYKEAIRVANNIPNEMFTISDQALLAECHINLDENVEEYMNLLQSTEYYLQLKALQLLKHKKYSETVSLLQNSDNCNALSLFYLSRAYWELKDYEKCHICLMKTAKLDPEHDETFLYLGHIYHYVKEDLEKAKKCYEKAFSLKNTSSEIVKVLSETYNELGLHDINFDFIKNSINKLQTTESCLYFRLGLHYLKKRDWENAIVNFRTVIKSNPKDAVTLECLADAYCCRGSYTSALRVYNKVISLDSNRTKHCLTRIGSIHSLLTQYKEALIAFEDVLAKYPYYFFALKGIAETYIRIARKKESLQLYGLARDCAQHAVDYITKALTKYNHYSFLWKFLGDSLLFITKLPTQYSFLLVKPSFNDEYTPQRKEKKEIFPQIIACYSYLLKHKIQSTFDLASAYMCYYNTSKQISHCNIAYNLALINLKNKPCAPNNWNLLGKICFYMHKYARAQHCFIKALNDTHKWSANIWCNLGTIYLKLRLYTSANYCYWRGQSTLPSYPNSWIGQAFIAEVIRPEEAMDLFRHASRLSYHRESALGYADWVCRILLKYHDKQTIDMKYVIDSLYAIEHAMDLLTWFSCFEPYNACAHTIHGILLERSGLLNTACKSFEKALKYVDESHKNIALLNKGRILMRIGSFDDAINMYKSITEASINSACGLALSLFKKGLYQESYSTYDTAFNWLSNNDIEKADLLVAMASAIYMLKELKEAKTLLFQSYKLLPEQPTAHTLFAICSLGLINSDQSLSKLALSELYKHQYNNNFGFDIGFLNSHLLVCENNMEGALKILMKSSHEHPDDAKIWLLLSQYCLIESSIGTKVASCCAKRAMYLTLQNTSHYNPSKTLVIASVAENLSGNTGEAMRIAKTGLHMYPDQSEIWAALLYSLLSEKNWMEKKKWICDACIHIRRHLNVTRSLSMWVGFIEKNISR